MLDGAGCNIAITLWYHDFPISPQKIACDLRHLFNICHRKILGPRYQKSPRRIQYWAVIKKIESAPHAHIGVRTSWAGLWLIRTELRRGLWSRLTPHGTHDFQPYEPG
jgi:hypothetical protein